MRKDGRLYRYIEISDVTKYGLITNYIEDLFSNLPTEVSTKYIQVMF